MNEGARVELNSTRGYDPRLSAAMKWFWGALGMAFVSGVYWVAASISNLDKSVVRILAQNEAVLRRLDYTEGVNVRQDGDIRDLERDVATINGRNMRGPAKDSHGR